MLMSTIGIPKEDLDKPAKPLLTAFISDVTSVEIGGKESCWCIVVSCFTTVWSLEKKCTSKVLILMV